MEAFLDDALKSPSPDGSLLTPLGASYVNRPNVLFPSTIVDGDYRIDEIESVPAWRSRFLLAPEVRMCFLFGLVCC